MIQNLPRETAWHLRGTRRIGVSKEDVETIQQCVGVGVDTETEIADITQIELVATFCGLRLHRVPRVADIEHEV